MQGLSQKNTGITPYASGGYIEHYHDCACGNPGVAAPCWHCTDCKECNCEVCDDFHYIALGEICPELQFLNPILYQKKMQEQEAEKAYKKSMAMKDLAKKIVAEELQKNAKGWKEW